LPSKPRLPKAARYRNAIDAFELVLPVLIFFQRFRFDTHDISFEQMAVVRGRLIRSLDLWWASWWSMYFPDHGDGAFPRPWAFLMWKKTIRSPGLHIAFA
jgi:hypothetical protein